jgi:nitronate monooxygenase
MARKLRVLRADELARVEAASRVGDYDIADVTVGESIGTIHDLPRAGDVVHRVVDEAAEGLAMYAPGSQKLPKKSGLMVLDALREQQ